MPRRPSPPPPRRRPNQQRHTKPDSSSRRKIVVISDDEPEPKRAKRDSRIKSDSRQKRESRVKSDSETPVAIFTPPPARQSPSLPPSLPPSASPAPPGSPPPESLSAAQLAEALEADGARLMSTRAAEIDRHAAHPGLEEQVKLEEATHDQVQSTLDGIVSEIDGIIDEIRALEKKKTALESKAREAQENVDNAFLTLRAARDRVERSIRQKDQNAAKAKDLKERIAAKRRVFDGAGERMRLVMAGLGMGTDEAGDGSSEAAASLTSASDAVLNTPTSDVVGTSSATPTMPSSSVHATSTPRQSQSSLASTPASTSISVSASDTPASQTATSPLAAPCTPRTLAVEADNPFLAPSAATTPSQPSTPAQAVASPIPVPVPVKGTSFEASE